jgi:hypothetical protein
VTSLEHHPDPSQGRSEVVTESRLEGGVNRHNLKFTT